LRKRDTSGYGVFINRCLPRLIKAAGYPLKPAYKYEEWACEIANKCVEGKYGSGPLGQQVTSVGAEVQDLLAKRAVKRASNGKTYATPAEQDVVERLSKLLEQVEAESESNTAEMAIFQLVSLKSAGGLPSPSPSTGAPPAPSSSHPHDADPPACSHSVLSHFSSWQPPS